MADKQKEQTNKQQQTDRENKKHVVKRGTDWRDDGEVGKMAAPGTGVVTQDHISFFKVITQRSDLWIQRDVTFLGFRVIHGHETSYMRSYPSCIFYFIHSFFPYCGCIHLHTHTHTHTPGTAPSPAWPPGAQGCEGRWTLAPRRARTRRRRSPGAP